MRSHSSSYLHVENFQREKSANQPSASTSSAPEKSSLEAEGRAPYRPPHMRRSRLHQPSDHASDGESFSSGSDLSDSEGDTAGRAGTMKMRLMALKSLHVRLFCLPHFFVCNFPMLMSICFPFTLAFIFVCPGNRSGTPQISSRPLERYLTHPPGSQR